MPVVVFPEIYQLRIRLCAISPLIWRRLLVRSDTSIADLHQLIQRAFGWTDSHLHRFVIHGKAYGIAYLGGISFTDDPQQVRLDDFRFRPNERFAYEYDFHDLWRHEIRLEQIQPFDPTQPDPVCIGGARAARPEECGGPQAFLALRQHFSIFHVAERLSRLWSSKRMSTTHKLNWRGSGIGLGSTALTAAPSIASSGTLLSSGPHQERARRCQYENDDTGAD